MTREIVHAITGATGLLGSHLAAQLRERGEHVRALVRPTSSTAHLQLLGVELQVGDLRDPEAIGRLTAGASVVYHCAARVSDWGPWSAFAEETVRPTQLLVEACRSSAVGRLVHVSSLSVYGNPPEKCYPITEDTPLGQRLRWGDHYARSKIEAEQIVRALAERAVVVRPCWTYGPRDRVTIPRLFRGLREGTIPIIGPGNNVLNVLYAEDVARGIALAGTMERAAGRAYNLSSGGELTQRQLLDALTDALGLPRIRRHVPFRAAAAFALLKEGLARLLRRRTPPTITRRVIYMVARPAAFSIERARQELGWQPEVSLQEGVRRAVQWYQEEIDKVSFPGSPQPL